MLLYYLKDFRNYYNRIFKWPVAFAEYEEHLIDTVGGQYKDIEENINFNPNDDVTTVIYANLPENQNVDYIVACNIMRAPVSRWFVLERIRTLGGQYKLTLRRDLLSDYWDQIRRSPMFIEKGKVGYRDSRLFNAENITVSQIRQDPILLRDETGCPWVVGYIPSNAFSEQKTISKKMVAVRDANITVESIENWEYYNRTQRPFSYQNPTYQSVFRFINYSRDAAFPEIGAELPSYYEAYWDATTEGLNRASSDLIGTLWGYVGDPAHTYASSENNATLKNSIFNFRKDVNSDASYQSIILGYLNQINNKISLLDFSILLGIRGSIIEDSSTGRKYMIDLVIDSTLENQEILLNQYVPSACTILEEKMKANLDIISGQRMPTTWAVRQSIELYRLVLTNVTDEVSTTIDSLRDHLEDQPFDMFCIPYGSINMITGDGSQIRSSKDAAIAIATEIAADAGSESVHDVQILPFCPIPEFYINGSYDLRKVSHSPVMVGTEMITALIWCRKSSFRNQIQYSIPEKVDPIEKKIESMTTMYRLVSPNYGSVFEFDPQKNNGVDYFTIDCTYKPYSPYIRVAPNFKGLYQTSGNISKYDARGLLCTGDFSLPQATNAWADYELRNKNYQSIFDRSIQNLETKQDLGRIQDIVGGIIGAAGAGAAAGGAAALAGMAAKAAAPIGIAATALSGVAGITDYLINESLREEAIDFTRDNFGYALGNIQALPNSLSKTGALHINNPLLPMLEIYRCSSAEYNAVFNKLKYNGFSIGSIEIINDALIEKPEYLKGQLIRIEGMGSHEASEIANELYKGVYFRWD